MMKQWISSVFNEFGCKGNVAATVILDDWPSTETMQEIAAKNRWPETTFIKLENDFIYVRWFTPSNETYLAGHASIAAIGVLYKENLIGRGDINLLWEKGEFAAEVAENIIWIHYDSEGIGVRENISSPIYKNICKEAYVSAMDIYLGKDVTIVLENESQVVCYQPNYSEIAKLPGRGLAVTAPYTKSDQFDYVNRFFCPKYGVLEDPVTGSSHSVLSRYWSKKLGTTNLTALQSSNEGGVVHCNVADSFTLIGGKESVLYESKTP